MDSENSARHIEGPYPLEIWCTQLEGLVYRERYPEAWKQLFALLVRLESAEFDYGTGDSETIDDTRMLAGYTRLAATVGALFTRASGALGQPELELLALHSRLLAVVFRLSGFRNADHLLGVLSEQTPVEPDQVQYSFQSRTHADLFAILHSQYSGVELSMEALLDANPAIAFPVYLGQFGAMSNLDPIAAKRTMLELSVPSISSRHRLPTHALTLATHLWMKCTYTEGPDKHLIKQALNGLFQRWLVDNGITPLDVGEPQSARHPTGTRPTVVVACERIHSGHVMFRCYAPLVRALRARFRIIVVAAEEDVDGGIEALADEVITIETSPVDPRSVVAKIRSYGPEVIYFPSLGMQVWTLLLANTRSAPIQIMTPGHPASSYSEFIDYYLLAKELIPKRRASVGDAFSETLIEFERGRYLPPKDWHQPATQPEENSAAVRIAVPSSLMKLTGEFLTACERIREAASAPVAFHFYPNVRGAQYLVARAEITAALDDAVVHRPMPYAEYLDSLARCDFCIGTFPFGGASSIQDALALGMSVVSMEGLEPQSRTEPRLVRLAGLPEWLIAESIETYVEAARRLVDDHEVRTSLRAGLNANRLESRLFDARADVDNADFTEAVGWILEHHETLREIGRPIWSVAERIAGAPTPDIEQ
jgi:hypothetical protein